MATVVKLHSRNPKPKTFTAGEEIIEALQEEIHICGRTSKDLAHEAGVSPSTIDNLRVGRTRWPRPTTLFPLMKALGLYFSMGHVKASDVTREK